MDVKINDKPFEGIMNIPQDGRVLCVGGYERASFLLEDEEGMKKWRSEL